MIRLADTEYWLDIAPAGDGWVLLRHSPGKAGGKTENLGRFTSRKHVLQCQRKLQLPKAAVEDLQALVDAMDAGDAAHEGVPSSGGQQPRRLAGRP